MRRKILPPLQIKQSNFGFRELGLMVINVAQQDAFGRIARNDARNLDERSMLQSKAIEWFIRQSRDYFLICDIAGINPNSLTDRMVYDLLQLGIIDFDDLENFRRSSIYYRKFTNYLISLHEYEDEDEDEDEGGQKRVKVNK